jgi:hypothetical protein
MGEGNAFSSKEYEAMRWISRNTDKDALFATNARYVVPDNLFSTRHFYYSAYSERRFYLEGADYSSIANDSEKLGQMTSINDTLFGTDDGLRIKTAEENGIDYIVVSKRLLPDPRFGGEGLEQVFSNRDVVIYNVV